MTVTLRSRTIASVLAATLVALPSNAALAAPPAQPTTTTTTPPASGSTAPAAGTTAPAAGTTTTSPTTGTPGPTDPAAPPADPNAPPADPNAVTDPNAPPDEGPDAVPVEEPAEVAQPETPPETPTTTVPEGPERPPEPTLGNGKFKAKGTGLMIAGGTLLGAGLIGMITSIFLTRCTDLDNSFACRNRHNNTFAVPATGAAALLGAVLLAVGLTYRVRYKRWENWDPNRAKTAFYPILTPHGGAGAGAMVKF